MSVEKRVRAYLELAAKDADAAELLLAGGNRYSAYHVQQAVEKITKALLLAQGIEAGLEHRLEELFKRFRAENEWPARLLPFVGYSAYATAFRYPTRVAVFRPIRQRTRYVATSRHFEISSWQRVITFSVRPATAEVDVQRPFENRPNIGRVRPEPGRPRYSSIRPAGWTPAGLLLSAAVDTGRGTDLGPPRTSTTGSTTA